MPKELVTHTVTYTHEVEMPPTDLLETDEQPLETPMHRATINLLIEQIKVRMGERRDYYDQKVDRRTVHGSTFNLLIEQIKVRMGERRDYYVGGNMFIYFSSE